MTADSDESILGVSSFLVAPGSLIIILFSSAFVAWYLIIRSRDPLVRPSRHILM
jgi:hypothetical protein